MILFYMSTAMPDDIFNKIVENCISFKPTYSGVCFDRNVAEGLSEQTEIKAVSFYPIPSYPKYKNCVQEEINCQIGSFKVCLPGMINFPIIKEISYVLATVRKLKFWIRTNKTEEKAILISGLYRCYIIPSIFIRMLYGIKVYAIVPDLPELMITYRKDYSPFRNRLNHIDVKIAKKMRNGLDGFIFLCPLMNEVVNLYNKPYLIIDGMVKEEITKTNIPAKCFNDSAKIVLYAGKISIQFGIDKLVESFLKADLKNVFLHLCGDGDFSVQLKRISEKNYNVIYHGIVSHDSVIEMEKRSTLLVDPRSSELPLSKMSFPSKIIEYMATGTPVLTMNLPCFSSEYQEYQYRFRDETILGMADSLREILEKPEKELHEFGLRAKEYIEKEKTVTKQCKKILDFLNKSIEDS